MSSEARRQICGNCGAPNVPDAVTCVVCGAVLSAYAQPPAPAAQSTTTTTSTTTPAPITTTPPPAALTTSGDWRSLFAPKSAGDTGIPEPPPAIDFDERDESPPITTTTLRPRMTTPAPTTTPAPPPTTTRPPQPRSQPTPRPQRPAQAGTTTVKPTRARPAPWNRPLADPRFNRRRPQTMVGVGAILLVLSCILPVFLALVGGSDLTVGLAFLCLFPLALIAMVTAIVISISRKEGRKG